MSELTKLIEEEIEEADDIQEEAYHHSTNHIEHCPECSQILVLLYISPHEYNEQSRLYYCLNCESIWGKHWYRT